MHLAIGGPLVFSCVLCACVLFQRGLCTLEFGVGASSDQKRCALVQSVSVPTFTHKRQGTQVCHSTDLHIHTYTLSQSHTHCSHTSVHTHVPSLLKAPCATSHHWPSPGALSISITAEGTIRESRRQR